jgi:hydrogenase expression/formation protein HypC
MCLAVPGRLAEVEGEGERRTGRVDFGGVVRQACLAYVPEARVGDYVLVHVGFAIARLDEGEARETLRALQQIGEPTAPEDPDAVR